MVAPKTLQHELDHVALAVVRRRRMGEYQQLHSDSMPKPEEPSNRVRPVTGFGSAAVLGQN